MIAAAPNPRSTGAPTARGRGSRAAGQPTPARPGHPPAALAEAIASAFAHRLPGTGRSPEAPGLPPPGRAGASPPLPGPAAAYRTGGTRFR